MLFLCAEDLSQLQGDRKSEKVMTERGKIMPKMHSGICNKHQRLLSESVKRARFLALIPFLVRPL